MRLQLVSDLHGYLPNYSGCACDVFVIAGDVVPAWVPNVCTGAHYTRQFNWLVDQFFPWVESLPAKHVVMTWGNHDWIGTRDFALEAIEVVAPEKLTILSDSAETIDGVKFYGFPWTPTFFNWAFNADEALMAEKLALIPKDIDVLISHGPPKGLTVDQSTPGRSPHLGSQLLLDKLPDFPKLRLLACGHIHGGAGRGRLLRSWSQDFGPRAIDVINASVVDEGYRLKNAPVSYFLEG